ncbi:MAG: hypothetical protein JJU13_19900 [Balneolaceae bacterium]|nr:hypothetical protein [Balneolaceae bacterium]
MSDQNRFHNWIFHSFSVSAEGLGLLRIITALFIFFFLIPGQGAAHFEYLSVMPDDFFAPPPGPLMLMDGFPSVAVFQTVQTVMMISLLAMLLGYRTKLASITAGLSILLLQGFIFSIGKVNHEILTALVPIVMAFSNWGAAFSFDSARWGEQKTESWPLTLLALFIGFMMFTAGFPKILGGWLDPTTQATQGHLFNQFFVRERQALLSEWFVSFDNVFFWELLDWATVLFEVGFLFAVWKTAWFKTFVGIAVLFHFSTMLMLNIAFVPNFLAYAVFLNWTEIYDSNLEKYRKWTGKRGVKSILKSVLLFVLILAILFAVLNRLSSMDLVLLDSDLMLHEVAIVGGGLLTVAGILVKNLLRRAEG